MRRYEELEHTADLKVRIYGRDLRELFANASWTLAELVAEPGGRIEQEDRVLTLEADDYPMLLVDWLSELLYLWEVEGRLCVARDITELSSKKVSSVLMALEAGAFRREIKAVTYHELEIAESEDGFEATVTFDI